MARIGSSESVNGWFFVVSVLITGGAGCPYELARRHGLHMGIDVGFSEEGTTGVRGVEEYVDVEGEAHDSPATRRLASGSSMAA